MQPFEGDVRRSKRTGEVQVFSQGQWQSQSAPRGGSPAPLIAFEPDPLELARARNAERSQVRQDETAERASRNEGRAIQNDAENRRDKGIDRVLKLRDDFGREKIVQEYDVGLRSLASALGRAPDGTGDTSLIYDYAKAMDPGSVVREAEMGMAASGDSSIEAAAAKLRKQFGVEGGGNLSPSVRQKLRREIATKVTAMNKAYSATRVRYATDARALGMDPALITGNHLGDTFMPEIRAYARATGVPQGELRRAVSGKDGERAASQTDAAKSKALDAMIRAGVPYDQANAFATMDGGSPLDPDLYKRNVAFAKTNPNYKGSLATAKTVQGDYRSSYAGQGLSGLNEGIASTLGAPVDLITGALNIVPRGINALTNSNLPTIERPFLGSEQIKDAMSGWAIYDQTPDAGQQFARRTAQSIGGAAVPALGIAGNARNFASQMIPAVTGGLGAAGAQQAFPGNPLAELGGELVGSFGGGAGMFAGARRAARRKIEAAVPTVDQLKQEAGNLYRSAERRGAVASPTQTRQLADDMRQTLLDEGQLGPSGAITNADTNTSKAFNLIGQYAGRPMRPKEMDSIRRVLADSRKSTEPSDQRLGKVMLDQFDAWVSPLAPDFDQARKVASRYIQAEDLQEARELAGARAGQFTGSGFENALRTEYRGLDRGTVKGRDWFDPEVSEAIQRVSRGTPTSNLARDIGRLAPTGPVPMMGSLGTAGVVGSMAGPAVGSAVGTAMAGAGMFGRAAATKMGIRNADIAELTARNGGALPQAPLWDEDLARRLAFTSVGQFSPYYP